MKLSLRVTFLVVVTALTLATTTWAQQKPFTQDQLQGLVRSGLGDESGAKLIEQHGIDFEPTDEFIQTLKASGANNAFVQAVLEREAGTDRTGDNKETSQ